MNLYIGIDLSLKQLFEYAGSISAMIPNPNAVVFDTTPLATHLKQQLDPDFDVFQTTPSGEPLENAMVMVYDQTAVEPSNLNGMPTKPYTNVANLQKNAQRISGISNIPPSILNI